MRKLVAIIFLVLLTSTTEAGELLKLPSLVNHWRLHKQEGRTTSFFDFMKEHYSIRHSDNDRQEDDQLPFKSMHIDHFMMVYVSTPAAPIKVSSNFEETSTVFLYTEFIPGTHLLGIFHPPRFSSTYTIA
ncbi:MAG: hypothetical protein ACM3VS_13190 [Candidatus Dadabacteria bacterium]